MASLRQRLSKWTLNKQQAEGSPKISSKKLHKALSTTFDYLASTVRHGATYIYQETEKDDLSECSIGSTPVETPKKHFRRSALFSSVRSRKGPLSPEAKGSPSPKRPPAWTLFGAKGRQQDAIQSCRKSPESAATLVLKSESSDDAPSLSANDVIPTLNVQIPDSSVILPYVTFSTPQKGEENCLLMEDPFISQDDAPYQVCKFINTDSPRPSAQDIEDTGYVAESESGAEQSGAEEFSPACLKYVAPGPSEAESGKACDHPHLLAKVEVRSKRPSVSASAPKPEIQPGLGTIQSPSHPNNGRLPSYGYEADAEMSEKSPPSMGSRTLFEHILADRGRRYLAVIGQEFDLEDDMLVQIGSSEAPSLSTIDGEGQNARQVSPNSDTDVSDNSSLKYAMVLTQDNAYEAGMRAAGIVCPSYLKQSSSTFSISKTDPQKTLVRRATSSLSVNTPDSCAVTTGSPSDLPPPHPNLHVRSLSAHHREDDITIPDAKHDFAIVGPANTGLHPSSPATCGDMGLSTALESGSSSPQRAFNAARLPNFGSPSTGSPKSKRALRQQRKADKKANDTICVNVDTTTSQGFENSKPQSQFSVQDFKPSSDSPPPYSGHPAAAVHDLLKAEVTCFLLR